MPGQLQFHPPSEKPLLLDGPTGTELERRGYPTALPLWTAIAARERPELLMQIHKDYVEAGADILTACTFRNSHQQLAKRGLAAEAQGLTRTAVLLAKQAAATSNRKVWVAGSIGPLEDCYRPQDTPTDGILEREHARHVDALFEAGCDLLLIETIPTSREALCAARMALASGLPVIVSLILGGNDALLGGEPLHGVIEQLRRLGAHMVSLNCASPAFCRAAVSVLSRARVPFGVYANSQQPDGSFGQSITPVDVQEYATHAAKWIELGASMIGGCCGTRPEHICRLRSLIDAAPVVHTRSRIS